MFLVDKINFDDDHFQVYNNCQVCSKFQGEMAVTETDEDYEGLYLNSPSLTSYVPLLSL